MRRNHEFKQGGNIPMQRAFTDLWIIGPHAAVLTVLFAMLQACSKPLPATECSAPPSVDGETTLTMEDGRTHITIAGAEALSWTEDCKGVRLISTTYQVKNGQLFRDRNFSAHVDTGEQPVLIPLRIQVDPTENPAAEKLADWQFDAATPHKFYPLEAYLKTEVFPSGKKRGDIVWGVRGTIDPNTGRPYRIGCEIPPIDPKKIESLVESRFHSDGTAKCRGSIQIRRGDRSVSVSLDVYARDINHITEIYNLVSADFAGRVGE